ncbi:hypothetical protein ABW20_dc0107424 [Dactylellina cionopaga]|nr:hypothetical protein ABW20_dc0107424 [Dactylellina cionopaga]
MSFLQTVSRRVLKDAPTRSFLLPALPCSRISRTPLPLSHQIRYTSTTTELKQPTPSTSLPTTPPPAPRTSAQPVSIDTPPPTSLSAEIAALKQLHTALRHQPPWYTTVHIHAYPYLVTLGDRIILPSLLYGPPSPSNPLNKPLQPGDIIRLTHASTLGSREYTIKGAPYIDPRLFTCRAVVVEITSEPMRLKKKTKRRQRKVKTVKSKHRYTVLRISELEVNELPTELETEALKAAGGAFDVVKDAA